MAADSDFYGDFAWEQEGRQEDWHRPLDLSKKPEAKATLAAAAEEPAEARNSMDAFLDGPSEGELDSTDAFLDGPRRNAFLDGPPEGELDSANADTGSLHVRHRFTIKPGSEAATAAESLQFLPESDISEGEASGKAVPKAAVAVSGARSPWRCL